MPEYEELVIVAKKGTVYAEELFCHRFQRALQKSITYCQTYPEEAFEIYVMTQPDKRKKTIAWEKASWDRTCPLLAKQQLFSLPKTKKLCHWLYQKQFIIQPVEPEEVIVPSLLYVTRP